MEDIKGRWAFIELFLPIQFNSISSHNCLKQAASETWQALLKDRRAYLAVILQKKKKKLLQNQIMQIGC